MYFYLQAVDPLMSCAAQKQRFSIHQALISKKDPVWDFCKFHISVQASCLLRHPYPRHPAKIVE